MKRIQPIVMTCLVIFSMFSLLSFYINATPVSFSEWINLTNNSNENDHPTWSPDGTEIVYSEWPPGNPYNLWKMKADGTGHTLLDSHSGSTGPDVSPDGTKIVFEYYVGSNYQALAIINYDGTGFHHVIGGPGEGSWQMACWSPTGEEILARRSALNNPVDPTQIFKINSDGTNLRQLTFDGTNVYPVWSPDGSKIVYVHSDDPSGHGPTDVWIMDSDGGNKQKLTNIGSTGGTTWAPDGSKIIFASGAQPHTYIMNSDGSNIQQLTTSDGSEENAEVSPDGSWLVFQGRINGIRDIYKIRMPTEAPIIASVDINPNALNLKSNGRWVTAYVELPEEYNVNDINVSSMTLNDTVPARMLPIGIGDEDSNGVPDLMVKFDREEVISYISNNVNMTKLIEEKFMTVTLTITGKLNDETPFQGSDTITIILNMPRK